jgi:hypothetical protein
VNISHNHISAHYIYRPDKLLLPDSQYDHLDFHPTIINLDGIEGIHDPNEISSRWKTYFIDELSELVEASSILKEQYDSIIMKINSIGIRSTEGAIIQYDPYNCGPIATIAIETIMKNTKWLFHDNTSSLNIIDIFTNLHPSPFSSRLLDVNRALYQIFLVKLTEYSMNTYYTGIGKAIPLSTQRNHLYNIERIKKLQFYEPFGSFWHEVDKGFGEDTVFGINFKTKKTAPKR